MSPLGSCYSEIPGESNLLSRHGGHYVIESKHVVFLFMCKYGWREDARFSMNDDEVDIHSASIRETTDLIAYIIESFPTLIFQVQGHDVTVWYDCQPPILRDMLKGMVLLYYCPRALQESLHQFIRDHPQVFEVNLQNQSAVESLFETYPELESLCDLIS